MRCADRHSLVVPIVLLLAALTRFPQASAGLGPQTVVRQFCQLDGLGQRMTIQGWVGAVAPLVAWAYEPAWDRVVLINGYIVGPPEATTDGALTVDVQYGVIAHVSALGVDAETSVEVVTFRLQGDGTWRIAGPPVPPHVFSERVDVDSLRQSLEEGGVNFVANSLFVWRMFRSVGWNVSFEPAVDLLSGRSYRIVDQPKPGDIAVYLRDGTPYHVGLLEAENQVVSSTLNAGIVRATTNAFSGEVKYLRLVRPNAPPPAVLTQEGPTYLAGPIPIPNVVPRQRRTATPSVRRNENATTRNVRTPAKARPAPTKRAKVKARSKKKPVHRPRATPAPHDHT